MIGTKLAHFTITAHLGSGGMGDVYQATDSKLGRSVAIKLLPEAFAQDAERAARFEREARALASLNHPNIAAIHGIEESGGRKFLVMELVLGETLAECIKQGPIAIDEALPIAKQIADGLEAAHEKGIIHRDLKPANVKITPDGKVKVLDFGLAKAYESEPANADFSNSPTMLSMGATNAGMILGTAAYMSPEQAKGRSTLDKRTDIFAFGTVLYEMLTGRQPFSGDTVPEILARVIEREPDWSVLPANLDPRIRELIHRCLEKDPKKRRRDMGDVGVEIEQALTESVPRRSVTSADQPRRVSLLWGIVTALAVAAATTFAVLYFRAARSPDAPETRVDIVTPTAPDSTSFAISPDGRRFVFLGSDNQLWLRSLDSTTAQLLAGTGQAQFPFWSPDSKSIGFIVNRNLERIDIGGGLPQILTTASLGRGGTWNSDGVILFGPANGPLFRIPASGGEAVAVTKLDPPRQTSHGFPEFLPGGRQFLFYAAGSTDAAGIYLGSLDSPETIRLTASESAGLYNPAGWLLYIRQGTLVARRFDPGRGELTGDPVTVADRVPVNIEHGAFSVSVSGLIAYRTGSTFQRRQLTWFDRTGKVLGTLGPPDDSNLRSPRLSPDGRRVVVERTVQGNPDIWIMDETRTTRFTFDAGVEMYPLWSADGTEIAFQANPKGVQDIYVKPSSGDGNEEPLVESAVAKAPSAYSPDGRSFLFNTNGNLDLQLLPLDGDRKPRLFLHTDFTKSAVALSQDGHWVSYSTNESGRSEIYVRPFPGLGSVWEISAGGGVSSRWAPNSKELYYIAPDMKLMAAPIATQGNTLIPGTPVALFQTHIALGGLNGNRPQFDVAPDGRFLINVVLDDSPSFPITLLQNWKPPAK